MASNFCQFIVPKSYVSWRCVSELGITGPNSSGRKSMSLTSNLRNRNSPVRCFFREKLPNTRGFAIVTRQALEQSNPVLPRIRKGQNTIGMAFDYRIRFFCGGRLDEDTPAWRGMRAWAMHRGRKKHEVGKKIFKIARKFIRDIQPVNRHLGNKDEQQLLRFCVVLAWFEQVYRAGALAVAPYSPIFTESFESVRGLLAMVPNSWVDDLKSLTKLFYREAPNFLVAPVIVGPEFAGSVDIGGADGDLIVGRCLVEIKTVAPKNPPYSDWVRQLLGYVFLDYDDQYRISEVEIYFARHGVFLKWAVDKPIEELSGSTQMTLKDARRQFRKAVRSSSQNAVNDLDYKIVKAGTRVDHENGWMLGPELGKVEIHYRTLTPPAAA